MRRRLLSEPLSPPKPIPPLLLPKPLTNSNGSRAFREPPGSGDRVTGLVGFVPSMAFAAIVSLAGLILTMFTLPETNQLSLEAISDEHKVMAEHKERIAVLR